MTTETPTFPPSTNTGFDDLLTIKAGQKFVLSGWIHIAYRDAESERRNGFETVSIAAERESTIMSSGWCIADVLESRAYIAPLSEILDAEGK